MMCQAVFHGLKLFGPFVGSVYRHSYRVGLYIVAGRRLRHARTSHRCAPNTPMYRTVQLLEGGDEVQQAASHALEPQPAAVAHVLGARGCVWQWRSRSMRGMHTHAKRRRTCGSRCRPGPARRQAAVEQPCWQPPWPRCPSDPS